MTLKTLTLTSSIWIWVLGFLVSGTWAYPSPTTSTSSCHVWKAHQQKAEARCCGECPLPHHHMHRVLKAALGDWGRIEGGSLPTATDTHSQMQKKGLQQDPTRPAHTLFVPLHSGWRWRSIRSRSNSFIISFYPQDCWHPTCQWPVISISCNDALYCLITCF